VAYGQRYLSWGFIKSCGWNSSDHPFRVEIHPTQMEVNGIPAVRFIAKATTAYFDHLDPAVDALGDAEP
jgi:hypothetical protein